VRAARRASTETDSTHARRGQSRTAGEWRATSGDSSLRPPPAQRAAVSVIV
jgi:hypothetical protein